MKRYDTLFLLVILCAGFFVRIIHLNRPLLDAHSFRQTQTATVAKHFAFEGINLFRPKLDILGVGKEQTLVLEFPLYQTLVSIIANFIGYSDGLGRMIAICFGIVATSIMYVIVKSFTSSYVISLVASTVYFFFPLNIYFQQAFMIESTVVAFHLLSLLLWLRFAINSNLRIFVCATLCTTLAFIQKAPYAPFLLPIIISIVVIEKKGYLLSQRKWLFGLILSLLLFYFWQKYADITNTTNGNSYFTSTNASQILWNIGTMKERLSILIWQQRISSIINSITKISIPFFFIGLISLTRKKWKHKATLFIWLGSMILYFITFFRIQSHEYYFMIVLPILSIFIACGFIVTADSISRKITNSYFIKNIIFYSILFCLNLVFLLRSVKNATPYFTIDSVMESKLKYMNEGMRETGYVLFILPEYDWSSVYTYYTNRRGITIGAKNVTKEILIRYKEEGYRYLVVDGFKESNRTNPNFESLVLKLPVVVNQQDVVIYKLI